MCLGVSDLSSSKAWGARGGQHAPLLTLDTLRSSSATMCKKLEIPPPSTCLGPDAIFERAPRIPHSGETCEWSYRPSSDVLRSKMPCGDSKIKDYSLHTETACGAWGPILDESWCFCNPLHHDVKPSGPSFNFLGFFLPKDHNTESSTTVKGTIPFLHTITACILLTQAYPKGVKRKKSKTLGPQSCILVALVMTTMLLCETWVSALCPLLTYLPSPESKIRKLPTSSR